MILCVRSYLLWSCVFRASAFRLSAAEGAVRSVPFGLPSLFGLLRFVWAGASVTDCGLYSDGELFDSVDVWELETVYGSDGKPVLTQHIFWELREVDGFTDYRVVAWRLTSQVQCQPQKQPDGYYIGQFVDRKDKVRRIIRAALFLETDASADFEVLDRNVLHESKRRGLKQK